MSVSLACQGRPRALTTEPASTCDHCYWMHKCSETIPCAGWQFECCRIYVRYDGGLYLLAIHPAQSLQLFHEFEFQELPKAISVNPSRNYFIEWPAAADRGQHHLWSGIVTTHLLAPGPDARLQTQLYRLRLLQLAAVCQQLLQHLRHVVDSSQRELLDREIFSVHTQQMMLSMSLLTWVSSP